MRMWKRGLISSIEWKKKKLRRREDLDAKVFPFDVVMEILARLPSKSLMRFKCVSKLWFSLIRSRYFTNLHHLMMKSSSSLPPTPCLLISMFDHLDCTGFSMEVCDEPRKSRMISLSSSSNNYESFDQDLTIPGKGGHAMVQVNGLILYMVCSRACIYNPTTRQTLNLPAIKSDGDHHKLVSFFLGHDPVLDQYKVLCNVVIFLEEGGATSSENWVFVLGGGSWKKIELDEHHGPRKLGISINGVIYYLGGNSISMSQDDDDCMLFCFDVRSEEFSKIQLPQSQNFGGKSIGFIEYGGKPTILDLSGLLGNRLMELWMLEQDGKWSNKSLVLKPCQMHLLAASITDLHLVEGTGQNGKVIFASTSMSYLLCYDVEKNDLRKVDIIREHSEQMLYLSFMFMDNKTENILHLET